MYFVLNIYAKYIHESEIIPLKYITSVECHNQTPPRVIIQYNTSHEYHRTEMEYVSYRLAEDVFHDLQKGLEGVHKAR